MFCLSSHSNLLTHVDLWHLAPEGPEAGRSWRYIFEDDIELFRRRGLKRDAAAEAAAAAATPCFIDTLEAHAAGTNASLLYLGAAAAAGSEAGFAWLDPAVIRLGCGDRLRFVQPCAPLQTHAYAIRTLYICTCVHISINMSRRPILVAA